MLDKEILQDFSAESNGLLDELDLVVEALEDYDGAAFPSEPLREFAQKIDRVMGAAKTLSSMDPENSGIMFLGQIAELCKTIGYQAVALQRGSLIPIFAGFWAETLELMREVLALLGQDEKLAQLVRERSARMQGRLSWLAEKVAPHSEEEKQKVLALLKRL